MSNGAWTNATELTYSIDNTYAKPATFIELHNILYIFWASNDQNLTTNMVGIAYQTYDAKPPIFTGLDKISDHGTGGNISLSWNLSIEDSAPVTYNIYMSRANGTFDFATANFTTENLGYAIYGLENGKEYFFVVRAEDARGNEDNNTVVKSIIPTKPDDDTSPAFAGIETAANLGIGGTIRLNWSAAIDPDTAESNSDPSLPIVYNAYVATVSGMYNFSTPFASTQNLSIDISGLLDKVTYFFLVRAHDSAGNEENNTVEYSAMPTSPPRILSHSPSGSAALANETIRMEFSEEMDHASVERGISITPPVAVKSFKWLGRNLTVTLAENLSFGTSYTVTINAEAIDNYGIAMSQEHSWTFTTEADTDGDGLPSSIDSDDDGDGMPDAWEKQYGFNPNDSSDANFDGDGDGFTNLEEYSAGTDPTDPKNHPDTTPWLMLLAIFAMISFSIILLTLWTGRKITPKKP